MLMMMSFFTEKDINGEGVNVLEKEERLCMLVLFQRLKRLQHLFRMMNKDATHHVGYCGR